MPRRFARQSKASCRPGVGVSARSRSRNLRSMSIRLAAENRNGSLFSALPLPSDEARREPGLDTIPAATCIDTGRTAHGEAVRWAALTSAAGLEMLRA
ncbi:hypothetical protein MES4922_180047 [Mesorhizobium ventifaucium]|uniref:Uncharacterized protein n=1 Tax=Mesorhizobium ventifaucium TaxID=666020 RepID=A0ABN8JGY1_9HYPH|nr:hypothetical protein MES4922_180047 [Mesorhizobium ventifaucium]